MEAVSLMSRIHVFALLVSSCAWHGVPWNPPAAACKLETGAWRKDAMRAAGAVMHLRGGSTFDDDPQKSLWYAAMLGDEEMCKLVLRQGADPNKLCYYEDEQGADGPDAQAQMYAAQFSPSGHCRTMEEMTPNALHMACIGGYDSLVQLLLQQSADVNRANDEGYTALHFAALMGHSSVCRLLIAAGADVAACDIFGDQPIDRAEAEGHQDVIDLLREAMELRGKTRTFGEIEMPGEAAGGSLEQLLDDVRAATNGSVWEKLKAGDNIELPRCLLNDQGDINTGKFGALAVRLEELQKMRERLRRSSSRSAVEAEETRGNATTTDLSMEAGVNDEESSEEPDADDEARVANDITDAIEGMQRALDRFGASGEAASCLSAGNAGLPRGKGCRRAKAAQKKSGNAGGAQSNQRHEDKM